MDGGEDSLFRPVRAGLLPYSAINDPAYDMEDFLLCNEMLDVEYENQARMRAANAPPTTPKRR